ncbi:MAG: HEAT repeat domain-containing protein [Candidatus Omnitrophica bacterium]|nr:HEAT repeat domain-containing protein [Candidatus Omnitrophota bacterium]
MGDVTINPVPQPAKKADNPADVRLASHFVGQFMGLLKGVQLYPPGHSMLQQIIEKFFSELLVLIKEKQQIILRIFENKLHAFDICLNSAQVAGAETLVRELQKRSIRQIIIEQTVSLSDIHALMCVLTTPEETVESVGGAREFMLQNGAEHIDVVEYYVRRSRGSDAAELAELRESDIFRFLIEDPGPVLSREQLRRLYATARHPSLCVELLKAAVGCLREEKKSPLAEDKLILQLLGKIQNVLHDAQFSEEKELRMIVRDIILAFEKRDLLELLLFNQEDEFLAQTGVFEQAVAAIGSESLAELVSEKIVKSEKVATLLDHVKKLLGRFFLDRKKLAGFLPVFKEKLTDAGGKGSGPLFMEICDAFSGGFSLEQDEELSMGTISAAEQSDILQGLEALKSVTNDRTALQARVSSYDTAVQMSFVVQEFLRTAGSKEFFQLSLNELIDYLRIFLEKDAFGRGLELVEFLAQMADPESVTPIERKKCIINSPNKINTALWEKLVRHALSQEDDEALGVLLKQLFMLLTDNFLGIVLKSYLREEIVARNAPVKELLRQHLKAAMCSYDGKLRDESAAGTNRFIDLFQSCSGDVALPYLWEITFHADRPLAQRALTLIAHSRAADAVSFLFRALEHPHKALRVAAVELMARFNYPDITSRVALIALGEDTCLKKEDTDVPLRLAALQSLKKLNPNQFREVLVELQQRKKIFFLPAEDKAILEVVREQLKVIG